MKKLIQEFIFALTFLTRIPVNFQLDYEESLPGRSMFFYPLVGAIIGLILIMVDIGGSYLVSPEIRGILVLIVLIYLSGGLHLDGLMDTVDGIFGGNKPERMREIMHDSKIGAFGVIALFLLLLLKFYLILELEGILSRSLFLMPVLSRFILVWISFLFPLAPSSKLGENFKSGITIRELAGSCSWLVLFCILLVLLFSYPLNILIYILIFSILVALFTAFSIYNKIEGLTGDSYGTILEITEIAVLFAVIIF